MTIPIKIISEKDFSSEMEQEKVWDSIAVPWGKYVVKKIVFVEEFSEDSPSACPGDP